MAEKTRIPPYRRRHRARRRGSLASRGRRFLRSATYWFCSPVIVRAASTGQILVVEAAVLHRHAGFVLQARPNALAGWRPQLQPLRPGRARSAARTGKAAAGLFQSFNLNVQVRDFGLQQAGRAAPPWLSKPVAYAAD